MILLLIKRIQNLLNYSYNCNIQIMCFVSVLLSRFKLKVLIPLNMIWTRTFLMLNVDPG